MKLATLRAGGRDGSLAVVSSDGARLARAASVAPTLQAALDDWERCEPLLRALSADMESGRVTCEPVDVSALHAPLPRAYEWVDGSA
ncbi:MAG: 2-keto-4-pentenoate hydratase, partial [Polyangiales bacterium]